MVEHSAGNEFQFHKGTIRTVFLLLLLNVLLDFNSIKVRLEHDVEKQLC